MAKSPFPSPLGRVTRPVSYDEWTQRFTGGQVFLETTLYDGPRDVHAPFFEAPSLWQSAREQSSEPDWQLFLALPVQQRGTSRWYVPYAETETVTEWASLEVKSADDFPLAFFWQLMPDYQLHLAFAAEPSSRWPQSGQKGWIFSYECDRLVEYSRD
ncbi:MAG: hypothetical protein AAFQ74_12470 [Cyanobacteria bacterium J06623_4]